MKPLCFIIMPFNKKTDPVSNREIDFNYIYEKLICPAVEEAGMDPIRADEEKIGGVIHKPMYERLILCDYAIADLTTANANVFYELGVRHVVRPSTTISIYAEGFNLPFDINFMRCEPYKINEKSELINLKKDKDTIVSFLNEAKRNNPTDSPIYQLLTGIKFNNNLKKEQAEAFKAQVEAENNFNKKIKGIVNSKEDKQIKIDAIKNSAKVFGVIDTDEIGIGINIILAYRSLEAYKEMVGFIEELKPIIRQLVIIQEQYGLALNRTGKGDEAIEVLEALIKRNGPSSETLGILARIYKDRFNYHKKNNETIKAKANLDKAIETYLRGFETDNRDYYPGVNAVTLMNIKGDERIHTLAPAVLYATQSKIKTKIPDYWDYATIIELAVISNDKKNATEYLEKAVTMPFDSQQRNSTIGNLKLIIDKKRNDGENVKWIEEIENELGRE